MKKYISIAILTILSHTVFALTPEERNSFVDFYRSSVNLVEEFPNKQRVLAIFADLDDDGVDDVLATSYGSFYEKGWLWSAFRKTSQGWKPINGIDTTSNQKTLWSSIFARPGEIAKIRGPEGKLEFLILGQVFDNQTASGIGRLNKSRFWIDTDGVLQQEKIENLESYIAYGGTHKDKLIQEMQVLKVETFDVPKSK